MPINYQKLERRLRKFDKKLAALFIDIDNSDIQNHIRLVQNYYNSSYEKAKKTETIETILESYEQYIESLAQIKNGQQTRAMILKTINATNHSRRHHVILADLAKVCDLLYWIATALTLYVCILLFALPTLFVQPVLGIATSITIGGLFLQTVQTCRQCLHEFKGWSRHREEYIREVALLSFFQPADTSEEHDTCFSFCL